VEILKMENNTKVTFSEVNVNLQCNKCFTVKTVNLFSKFDVKCSCGGQFITLKTENSVGNSPHCNGAIKVIKTQNGFKFIKKEK